jgi:hypothetical protein
VYTLRVTSTRYRALALAATRQLLEGVSWSLRVPAAP